MRISSFFLLSLDPSQPNDYMACKKTLREQALSRTIPLARPVGSMAFMPPPTSIAPLSQDVDHPASGGVASPAPQSAGVMIHPDRMRLLAEQEQDDVDGEPFLHDESEHDENGELLMKEEYESDHDLDGEPLEIESDLDGEPLVLDPDLDGEPLEIESDLDGEPLELDPDLDGEPLDNQADTESLDGGKRLNR